MLQFDLNLSITMRELPLRERFDRAAALGFDSVEFWWPAGEDLASLAAHIRDAGLRVVLFNFDGGSLADGERGLLNDPAREAQFRAHVPVALDLAVQIGCPRINALVGNALPGVARSEQLEYARQNLAWAADLARQAGVTLVVESLNAWETPRYLLTNTPDTLAFLDGVALPVEYQYDIYHMQRMEGNIVATLRQQLGRIGHIQIADSPGRNQPRTGELNFGYILQQIAASDYAGFVGLEYLPLGTLEASLDWLPPELRRGPMSHWPPG